MTRRHFLTACAVTPAASFGRPITPKVERDVHQPARFVLGCQSGPADEERLRFFKRHGVDHICGWPENWRDLGRYTWKSSKIVVQNMR